MLVAGWLRLIASIWNWEWEWEAIQTHREIVADFVRAARDRCVKIYRTSTHSEFEYSSRLTRFSCCFVRHVGGCIDSLLRSDQTDSVKWIFHLFRLFVSLSLLLFVAAVFVSGEIFRDFFLTVGIHSHVLPFAFWFQIVRAIGFVAYTQRAHSHTLRQQVHIYTCTRDGHIL